jgi:excisionase family DNA binding protein
MDKLTINARELSELLGVSIDTIYKMTREKEIPHVALGRRVLYRKESIEQWLKENETRITQKSK